jgi:predicted AAA+ superfamily ATPase
MSETLKPWYAIATPHQDIREGRLAEAVFAANVWAVVQGTAPEVYLDPEEFFRKTYLTKGLSTMLGQVAGALRRGGESGDRIISLQTAFGGGKTHTLVALWHLAKHADRLKGSPHAAGLRKAIGGQLPEKVKGVAVFTNQTCDATQGRQVEDGVHLRTLWGELAYQLGGKALYERVRANDESQRVPQGLFVEILQAASPCLILLDELADYCVGAAAVPVGDTSLADQTVSFIQQLTESVQQVPGAVVVATLPASKYEVAQSEKGQEAFVTLEQRFQRLGADVKPVADEEIYEVVRARLFESIAPDSDSDYPKKVAQVYQGMYAAHSGEVPSEAAKNTYREQLQRAYPFHPLLIDALYTRWGSYPDFQRTRGVLRLLASIVGDLWKRRQGTTETQHLIQPCHVRWSVDALQAALARLWGPAYQSVAAADVIGDRSNAGIFDEERGGDYRSEAIAMDVAMRYERSRGWTPTDVSWDGEHYDVRSEGPGGEKRFIEVKGRAQSGAIVLTGPEVDKLRQLGERAWLYIVTFCKGERPRLRIIQDPISRLNPEMLYRQIQFVVEQDEWVRQGEEVVSVGGEI